MCSHLWVTSCIPEHCQDSFMIFVMLFVFLTKLFQTFGSDRDVVYEDVAEMTNLKEEKGKMNSRY